MNREIIEAAKVCSRGGLACYGCEYRLASEHVRECTGRFAKAIVDHHERYGWHDLRKYPNDLPEDDSKEYFIKEVWRDGEVSYCAARRDYIVHHGIPTDVYNFTVVAWREIDEHESEDSDG